MNRQLETLLLLTISWMAASSAVAHDLWIEPSDYEPALDQAIAVRLRIGEAFHGEAASISPRRLARFVAGDGEGQRSIVTTPSGDPAGFVNADRAGHMALGLETHPSLLELPAIRFESYLKEEGLDSISELRRQAGETGEPGRELFSRSVKSLIRVSGEVDVTEDRTPTLDLPLEFVTTRSPYDLQPGDRLPLRLLFNGQPLAGTLIVAISRDRPDEAQHARSDAAGYVEIDLAQPGDWLVKAVHMLPAEAGSAADWHSWWTALTFSIPAR